MDYTMRNTHKALNASRYGESPIDTTCDIDGCEGPVPDGIGMHLCKKHLQLAWAAYQIVLGADVPDEKPDETVNKYAIDTKGVVYIVRVGELIKIGWTRDFRRRQRDLKADAVMFTAQGTRKDEYKLQAKFLDHLAKGREWFACTPETLQMVDQIRLGKLAA